MPRRPEQVFPWRDGARIGRASGRLGAWRLVIAALRRLGYVVTELRALGRTASRAASWYSASLLLPPELSPAPGPGVLVRRHQRADGRPRLRPGPGGKPDTGHVKAPGGIA